MIALTDLDVYNLGERLSDMVWEDYDHWREKALRTIGFQIIRSSDSISINIAEGYGQYTAADRKNFYRYSRDSFEETMGWLRKAARTKLVDESRMQEYQTVIVALNAFINSTNKRYEK